MRKTEFVINVLIVDDKPRFARNIETVVNEFASRYPGIVYSATVISGISGAVTFNTAKTYIELNQDKIDILLIDYNIGTYLKGTDLFKLVDKESFLIYKVLHSITAKSQKITQEDFKNLYDDFCYSKDTEDIRETLIRYELKVLDVKLNGNKEFRNKYFLNDERLNEKAEKIVFNQVRYFDVLYVETEGGGKESVTIYYRNLSNGKTEKKTSTSSTIKLFKDQDLYFCRVSSSLIVNLLWVAKTDTIRNKIHFITINNIIFCTNFYPSPDLFKAEVLPHLLSVDKIHPFFRD